MKVKKHYGYDVITNNGIEQMPYITDSDIKNRPRLKIILQKWIRKSSIPEDVKIYFLKRVPYLNDEVEVVSVNGWTNHFMKRGNMKISRVREEINEKMDDIINENNFIKLDVIIQDLYKGTESVKTYHIIDKTNKIKMWNKHVKLNKPSKMESKKMSGKKSPVKRMTGDIGALGKNFNKLI